jgi:hypothetical protein
VPLDADFVWQTGHPTALHTNIQQAQEGTSQMRKILLTALLAVATTRVTAIAADTKKDNASVEQRLTQIEKDWSQAGIKKSNLDNDVKFLEKTLADDWSGIDFQGNTNTKSQSIANLKSGASTTQSIDLLPLKVRVFGNTAVVTGGDTEKSTYKGKDSSGKYAWTDVFVNRNGHWQAVASETTKVQQ